MNGQLSLLENIQSSFLSTLKSKHTILKRGFSMLIGNEVDETTTPPSLVEVDPEIVNEITSWVLYICETNQVPDQVQKYADHPHHSIIFITLFTLFSEAVRTRTTAKLFKETLQYFNLPRQYQDLLSTSYNDNQQQLTQLARNETTTRPSMEQFDWRVDVIISTTSLNKAFIPVLLLQMTTTDNNIHTFECPIAKFHQLRYSVAKMLANMQTIQSHPTLARLID